MKHKRLDSMDPRETAAKESVLTQEVFFIILQSIILYVRDFKHDLKKEANVAPGLLTDRMFSLLTLMLKKNLSDLGFNVIFNYIKYIIQEYAIPLFKYSNSFCGELCYALYSLCNNNSFKVRSGACALLINMIKVCLRIVINE